jgi:diguanylate cyclase (GGDEF)-like protein/PAS domain S-box-containing protein
MPGRRNIARLITILAGLILSLVVVIVPSGHFIVSYQYITGALETEIEINAQMIMQVISANPEMWEFEQVRLQEYLTRRATEGIPEVRRVLNMQNEVIAAYVSELSRPVIMRSMGLFDAGMQVGRIEIYRSLNPLVKETVLIALVMLPLGLATFFILRYLPIRSIYEAERSLRNTNEFLNRVLEDTTDAIAVTDLDGTVIHSNRRASEISGYPPEGLAGRNYKTLLPPEVIPLVREQAEKVVSGRADSFHMTTTLLRSDGQLRDVSLGGSPLLRDGKTSGIIISADDITERKYAEEALREAKERYQRIVEDIPDLMCRFTPDTTLTFVNEEFARSMGMPASALEGKSYLSLMPAETHDAIRKNLLSLTSVTPVLTREHEVVAENGRVMWQFWRDRALFDRSGRLAEIQSIGQDITERKRLEVRLRALSLTDELTGLYNRRGFLAMAEQQMKVARRLKKPTLLISADLDGLKTINDTLGHHEGDLALIEAGRIMRECFRESDIVARIGGDEFVVFQMENEPVDEAVLVSRVQKKLDAHNAQKNGAYALSLSVGTARFGHDTVLSLTEMLDAADKIMYERKRERRRARA